ncbi:MAG: PKD domain-containing protein [Bacteroidota bacterium]
MRLNLLLTTALIICLGSLAYSQCPPGPLGTGNFLDKPTGCATFGLNIEFTPLYSQLEDNSVITIDWGDGTANSTIPVGTTGSQTGISFNTPQLHTYTEANTTGQCVYEIVAFVTGPNGCYTQEETTVRTEIVIWNTDNFPALEPDPILYEVCAGTASSVRLQDLSPWNCTDPATTTSLNQNTRWTQWIYGNVNGITGTVTVDGNPVGFPFSNLPDAHPGPVLDPQAPGNQSLEVFIPATALVGEEFSIDLNNWNQCNPYEDASGVLTGLAPVSRRALIRVIAPPVPEFEPREGSATGVAPVPPIFCIEQDIYFANQTTGTGAPYNYRWEFYDGPNDTDPLVNNPGFNNPSTAENPIFQFTSGGDKLVRLIATDPNAEGDCDAIHDEIITLSPDAVANFDFYDGGFSTVINPDFCQTGGDTFTVGFRDNTTLVPNTQLLFEFYREGNPPTSGVPDDTEPPGGVFSATNIPDFTRSFSNEEYVIVRLLAQNSATSCSSMSEDTIFVYGRPQPDFIADDVCEGSRTSFTNIADEISSLTTRVNDDEVDLYEWDFSFDGTFNTELIRNNSANFDWFLNGANIPLGVEPTTSTNGTFTIALRMTTRKGGCSDIVSFPVTVDPNPDAQLSHDALGDLCPGDTITFSNDSNNPTLPGTTYTLAVSHPPSAFSTNTTLTLNDTPLTFENPDDTTRTFLARITAITPDGCISMSNVERFRVSPDEEAEFDDPAYNIFNTNCSPWTSTMIVDPATQALNPDAYTWTLSDENGVVAGYPISRNSSDANFNRLDYDITNTSATIQNYQMVLEADKAGICIANDTFNIQISPQPNADFTFERTDDCERVNFTLEAIQKGLADYNWSFNPTPDIINGAEDEFQISYLRQPNTGADFNAEITLVTTNLADCQSAPEILDQTIEKERPNTIADFTLSATTLQIPNSSVLITNTSTTNMANTYVWDFGDGSSFTGFDPISHEYTRFGTYQITLEITDAFCTIETSQTITVLPAAPILDFEADILEGCAPLTVQFTNLSQFAEPGKFLWEFGDGSISRSDNPTHTFFAGGDFTVRLRGQNEVGENSEIQKESYVTVYARPFADFLASARVVFIPDQEALFRNLSENATSYFWDFGDGTTSTETEPRHAYTEEGFYDITLIATNDFGCIDTLFRSAEIQAVSGGQVNTPNAFTPSLNGPSGGAVSEGGDPSRINDVFLPRLEGVERFRMLIYNKWGELIFETTSQDRGWDGYYKSKLSPAGVYVYKLELRFSDGRDLTKVGDVTLIR